MCILAQVKCFQFKKHVFISLHGLNIYLLYCIFNIYTLYIFHVVMPCHFYIPEPNPAHRASFLTSFLALPLDEIRKGTASFQMYSFSSRRKCSLRSAILGHVYGLFLHSFSASPSTRDPCKFNSYRNSNVGRDNSHPGSKYLEVSETNHYLVLLQIRF